MPTYEYVCKACGHRLEAIQSMTEPPLTVCPECGGELRKVFAPPAISFKGSGFYSTDARNKPKATTSSTDAKDGSSDKSSDKSKDGSKPADKPADKKKESASTEKSS